MSVSFMASFSSTNILLSPLFSMNYYISIKCFGGKPGTVYIMKNGELNLCNFFRNNSRI